MAKGMMDASPGQPFSLRKVDDIMPVPIVLQRRRGNINRAYNRYHAAFATMSLAFLWVFIKLGSLQAIAASAGLSPTLDLSSACVQVDPLTPKHNTAELDTLDSMLGTDTFRNLSVARLSGIVKIPSVSFDDFGEVGEDERFNIFYDIESYLETTFPRVHAKLHKQNVNTHGLLFTWNGTDRALQPSILMAHQDVVPVEESTIDSWTHPPFSGHYDGKYVWGRGASDCKNQLISILSAVELLLEYGFVPKRTLLLSFGFDEEVSGPRGARTLAARIQELYGENHIAAVVDEGNGPIFSWGSLYAAPAVAEKGYTDIRITVRTPGGHSSIPSDHTSIGILSELITLIEKHRYRPWLADENPYLGALQCGAKYSPSFPRKLKQLLAKRLRGHSSHMESPNSAPACQQHKKLDLLAEAAAEAGASTRYLFQTSQAVDLISGGAKVNALPEKASAVVNHRVNIGEHPLLTQSRISSLASYVAKKYNLTLVPYPANSSQSIGRSITLDSTDKELEPAPPTPWDVFFPGTQILTPWGVFSGTIRSLQTYKNETVKVVPALMTGNTDTRYYWNLTRHIFRYNPGFDEDDINVGLGNIHTVDERQSVTGHIGAVHWFTRWVRNLDEAAF